MATEKTLLKMIKRSESCCTAKHVNDPEWKERRLAFYSDGSSLTYPGMTIPIRGPMKHWHNPKHQSACVNEVLWIEMPTDISAGRGHQFPCNLDRLQDTGDLVAIPGWNGCFRR